VFFSENEGENGRKEDINASDALDPGKPMETEPGQGHFPPLKKTQGGNNFGRVWRVGDSQNAEKEKKAEGKKGKTKAPTLRGGGKYKEKKEQG